MNSKSRILASFCTFGIAGHLLAQPTVMTTWTLSLTGQYGILRDVQRGDVMSTTGTLGREKIAMPDIVSALGAGLNLAIPSTAKLVSLWDGTSDPAFYLVSGNGISGYTWWPVTNNVYATTYASYMTGTTTTNAVTGQYSDRGTYTYEINLTIDKSPDQQGFDETSFYILLTGTVTEKRNLSTAKNGSIVGTVTTTVSALTGYAVLGQGPQGSSPYFVDLLTGTARGTGTPQ